MEAKNVKKILIEIAYQYRQNGDKWRALAYNKAADAIGNCSKLNTEFHSIKGIGPSIADKIQEIIKTGKSSLLEKLKKNGVPSTLVQLEKLQGVGSKTAIRLWKEYGISDLKSLMRKIKKIDEPAIAEAINYYKSQKEKILLSYATEIAEDVLSVIKDSGITKAITVGGSIRRKSYLVRDIDFITSVDKKHRQKFFNFISKKLGIVSHGKSKIIFEVKDKSGDPRRGDIVMTNPTSYGNAINYLTGSKQFNIVMRTLALKKNLTVNEKETKKKKTLKKLPSEKEKDLFSILKIPYVPPECRITGEEVGKDFSSLLTDKDIKGDVHIHTILSDGKMTPKTLVSAAKKSGFSFVGISDHSPSLGIAGFKISSIKRGKEKFTDSKFPVYFGSEVDVKVDGSLAYNRKNLLKFDYLILATHSAPSKKIADRFIKSMKFVSGLGKPIILAHITNRKAGRNSSITDWDRLFKACVKYGAVIEINAQPDRMDPPALLIRRAKTFGLKFAIGSDSHNTSLDLKWGVIQARKGLLTSKDVINTSHKSFLSFLNVGKPRRHRD